MDITALYPSIDQEGSAKIVKEEFLKSELNVEEVDWKAAGLHLALLVSREELIREGIYHLVPRRKVVRGRKPTVRTQVMPRIMSSS